MRVILFHVILILTLSPFCFLQAQAPAINPGSQLAEIVVLEDSTVQPIVQTPMLYDEGWDRLNQIRFWRRVMNLSPDYSLLSIADTRQVLNSFATVYYDTLTNEAKRAFKDSMKQHYRLPQNTRLYVTYGKKDFYQIRSVLPDIGRAISIFQQKNTDPWFAQTILLIESPGQLASSPVGANGPFQLMRYVAVSQGLKVSAELDEREDFEMAAGAAATYLRDVCIPETKNMLRSWRIPYDEDALWFKLLTLHVYHAGARNVAGVLRIIRPRNGGMDLIQQIWKTSHRRFRNASQNYSQVALASLLELDRIIQQECSLICP